MTTYDNNLRPYACKTEMVDSETNPILAFNGLVLLGKSSPETIDFPMKYGVFLSIVPQTNPILT